MKNNFKTKHFLGIFFIILGLLSSFGSGPYGVIGIAMMSFGIGIIVGQEMEE